MYGPNMWSHKVPTDCPRKLCDLGFRSPGSTCVTGRSPPNDEEDQEHRREECHVVLERGGLIELLCQKRVIDGDGAPSAR